MATIKIPGCCINYVHAAKTHSQTNKASICQLFEWLQKTRCMVSVTCLNGRDLESETEIVECTFLHCSELQNKHRGLEVGGEALVCDKHKWLLGHIEPCRTP